MFSNNVMVKNVTEQQRSKTGMTCLLYVPRIAFVPRQNSIKFLWMSLRKIRPKKFNDLSKSQTSSGSPGPIPWILHAWPILILLWNRELSNLLNLRQEIITTLAPVNYASLKCDFAALSIQSWHLSASPLDLDWSCDLFWPREWGRIDIVQPASLGLRSPCISCFCCPENVM